MTEPTKMLEETPSPQDSSRLSIQATSSNRSDPSIRIVVGERLPNLPVGADLIMKVTEGCAMSEFPLSVEKLAEYASTTDRAIKEAIKAGLWLALIEPSGEGYVGSASVRSEFPIREERKTLVFLRHLQRKKSFVQFSTFLDYDNDPISASSKVRVLYQIDVPAQMIMQLFGSWGRSAGVLEGKNRSLRLKPEYHADDLPTEYIDGLKDALESDMKARVFINRKLTEETFRSLPEAGIDRAVHAIRGIGQDPRNAVEDAGELLEDFLRIKAERDGVSAKGTTGIGGVLGLLDPSKNELLTAEHNVIGDALNTLRIMSAHPTRAATGLRWEIKPDSGLEVVLLVLSLIRSIQEYDRTKSAIF